MKIYLVINSNAEGTNFLGAFSTKEAAQVAIDRRQAARDAENMELFKDDPEEAKQMVENDHWWNGASTWEWELNDPELADEKWV